MVPSLLLLSLLLASLCIIFAPSLVSSLVYNSSYASSLAIATALLAACWRPYMHSAVLRSHLYGRLLNASSLAVKARRVSSLHRRPSFSFQQLSSKARNSKPESEYRRRVEHLQTSMGCVCVRIRSRPRRLVIRTLPMRWRQTGR